MIVNLVVSLWVAWGAAGGAGGKDTSGSVFPEVDALPVVNELPDPLRFADGSPVKTAQDWQRRRGEIRELLLHYEYGRMPPAPEKIEFRRLSSGEALGGKATLDRLEIVLGDRGQVRIGVGVFVPRISGRTSYPVVLAIEPVWHNSLRGMAQQVVDCGYIFAGYDKHDVDKDDADRSDGVHPLYPDYDWGTLAAWAWGGMRVVDYLLTRKDVDGGRIAITGHSRAGKTALLAGAMDERIALVVPHASGAGGASCFRIMGRNPETLSLITNPKRFHYWFHPRLATFARKENRLPFDQHFLRAMVAPRAVLSQDGTGDLWANPLGAQYAYLAAQPVFDLLGVPDRNAVYFRPGGHDTTTEDVDALLDFADRLFFGKSPKRTFNDLPYPVSTTMPIGLSGSDMMGWSQIIGVARKDEKLQPMIRSLVDRAREEVRLGIMRRAHRLAEVGTNRTWLDGRTAALEDEIKETFALAMSDAGGCGTLAQTLPTVAVAARLTGEAGLREHVIAQLRELSTWSPLQRPGWTLYAPGHRLPKDGKDGNWLGTGVGVRAIVTTLDIMGDEIPEDLRQAFRDLLAKEVAGVVDDWQTQRPWFVRGKNPITNQWVLPTEGLIRACLWLGRDTHRDAYELGVRNLTMALDAHGKAGEFEEGIGYAGYTITSMVHAARAMAVAGDRRAIDHPFLANFPTWAVLHIQPGRMTVNCFDAGNASIPRNDKNWRSLLALLVGAGGSEVAHWALCEQFEGPPDNVEGLVASVVGRWIARREPPAFAAYERAPMVVWRDSWKDDATGVWVRGGHALDQHDHQDRGHVNFILRGKAVLIEAGTPSYSNPLMNVEYASGAGHNVLQIGTVFPDRPYPVQKTAVYPGWQRPHGIAPITVSRLDADGGAAAVEAGKCYEGVSSWKRQVKWSGRELSVRDEVTLSRGRSDVVLFRWHLGASKPVTLKKEGAAVEASWDGLQVRMTSAEGLDVSQIEMPDATLSPKEDHRHTCLVVKSAKPVSTMVLDSTFGAAGP